jgi:transcriptional regulator with XRE-family HTH domain
MAFDVGKTIRALRKQSGLNIADIAERTNLTISHVSQIERGVANPSLSALNKIAKALNVHITRLFHENPDTFNVVRAGERKKIFFDKAGSYIALLAGGRDQDSIGVYFSHYIGKKLGQDLIPHEGKEFFYVAEGGMKVHLESEVVNLKQGDSLFFDSNIPHKVVVVKVPLDTIIVTTSPASFMQTLDEFLPRGLGNNSVLYPNAKIESSS